MIAAIIFYGILALALQVFAISMASLVVPVKPLGSVVVSAYCLAGVIAASALIGWWIAMIAPGMAT